MKTVLGLSVTAAGVGWVLVDGTTPVDDDKFVVRDPAELVSRCLAAVRGAQSIAASSGRPVDSIGVCWSPDVEDRVDTLLAELRAAGCTDVRSVRQVTPVADQQGEAPLAERPERVDLCGLLAQLVAYETDTDTDPESDEDVTAAYDVTSAPGAGTTPAYDAARAVATNAAPPEPVTIVRPRRSWTPEKWTPAVSGTRVMSAAAVTAVVAVFAVGSQFVGTAERGVQDTAALANRSSDATTQTSQVVQPEPPAAQPMAVPEPAAPPVAALPVQLAVPEPVPEAEYVEPVSVPAPEPVVTPQAQEVVAEAVPHIPDPVAPPAAVPDPAVPSAPPELPPPAPPVPFWLAPPFVPAPPPPPPPVVAPAPAALVAPVEPLPPPVPVPPPAPVVNPVFGALP